MYPEGIKIVHWNCQGANGKLAAIKDVIQKDGINILLLQDTRFARRNDGLQKLRLDGYSTYDTPKSEKSHGMMILVHKDNYTIGIIRTSGTIWTRYKITINLDMDSKIQLFDSITTSIILETS